MSGNRDYLSYTFPALEAHLAKSHPLQMAYLDGTMKLHYLSYDHTFEATLHGITVVRNTALEAVDALAAAIEVSRRLTG